VAIHTLTGTKVAIKILDKRKIKTPEMADKVQREINILELCHHPHVIRLYEVIDTPSDIFMVMEYVANGELFDYIVDRGRLPQDDARRFFQQIISGVEYCHYRRIVHRDLKPENLLLDNNNNIKIADFGLSNVMIDGNFLKTSCGSPNYAAPEVISGHLYAGAEVDVWSCGVILYALLCGTLPFDEESIPNLFRKIKSGMYSMPSHLSEPSRDLILRMLVVDPMKRITLSEVRDHRWFRHAIPLHLSFPPETLESQESRIEDEVASKVLTCIKGSTHALLVDALYNRDIVHSVVIDERKNLLRVAYELFLAEKRQKERIEDLVVARKNAKDLEESGSPQFGSPTVLKITNFGNSTSPSQPAPIHSHTHTAATGGSGGGSSGISGSPSSSTRRRRWYLGIQSKKDPTHIMNEVYSALMVMNCKWRVITPYRIVAACAIAAPVDGEDDGGLGMDMDAPELQEWGGLAVVKVALSLYKVQHAVHLLDFQLVEGSPFSFMKICAILILELKRLSQMQTLKATIMSEEATKSILASQNP